MCQSQRAAMHELGEKLMDYFTKEGHNDFVLYLNDQSWSPCLPEQATHTTSAGTHFHLREPVSVEDHMEFFNRDTVNMIFDGSLYEAINYGDGSVQEALMKILHPYDLYFEMGYPFSMAAYSV